MRLLIMDFIRRHKWTYGFAVLYIVVSRSTIASAMALYFGPALASRLDPREILNLPLSRKEIWRARWILSIVVPAILVAVSRLLALAMQVSPKTAPGLSWVLLSSTYALIYVGTLVAVYIPIAYCIPKTGSPIKPLLIKITLFVAASVGAFVLEDSLPTQWHELTGGAILFLAMGLCLTSIAFFHSPKIAPRPIVGERPGRSSRPGKPDLRTRYLRTGHTGLKLLVWHQTRVLLFAGILFGIASQLALVITGWLKPDGPSPIERGATIFFAPTMGAAITFITPVLFVAIWIVFAQEFLGVRHLRALPLTTRTLAAMFTLMPALFWLTFWAFPLAGYWILAGHWPSTLRLDLLAGLIGLTCFVSSSAMQAGAEGPAQFFAFPLLACAGFMTLDFYGQPLSPMVTSLIGVFGLIGVAVSFPLTCRALQQNSSMYTSKLRLLEPVR